MGLLHEYFLAGDDIEAGGEGVDVGLRSVVLEAYALQVVDVVGTLNFGIANENFAYAGNHALTTDGYFSHGAFAIEGRGNNFAFSIVINGCIGAYAVVAMEGYQTVVVNSRDCGVG